MPNALKLGNLTIDPTLRYVLIVRHLQQLKAPDAAADDWLPNMPIDWNVVGPQIPLIRAAYLQDVPIEVAVCSHFARTLQTLAFLMPQAKKILRSLAVTPVDHKSVHGTWAFLSRLEGETAAECFALAPDVFISAGHDMMVEARGMAAKLLDDGQIGAIVSHNPLCEALTAEYFGGIDEMPMKNYRKGDIGVMIFDGENPTGFHFLPAPPVPVSPHILAADGMKVKF